MTEEGNGEAESVLGPIGSDAGRIFYQNAYLDSLIAAVLIQDDLIEIPGWILPMSLPTALPFMWSK